MFGRRFVLRRFAILVKKKEQTNKNTFIWVALFKPMLQHRHDETAQSLQYNCF